MGTSTRSLLKMNRKTIAKLISQVEDRPEQAGNIIDSIYRHTGKAYVIGITGPPGCGKSTLVDKLALEFRKAGRTVAIIAVDPTSPFSGGALMGNRIRMNEASKDKGVFIRSMATRGGLGGLARATGDAVKILDAAGFDYIIIETVGAGQVEVEIAKTAYTTVVVTQPESGDIVQTMKAGIMEIGDIFVVNKSDMPGTDKTVGDLEEMLNQNPGNWRPKIVKTVATSGSGVDELAVALEAHRNYLEFTKEIVDRKKAGARKEIERLVEEKIRSGISKKLNVGKMEALLDEVVNRNMSSYQAIEKIIGGRL